MKRCKHENAVFVQISGDWQWFVKHCYRCGQDLPLGPAVDSPESLVELRAAEIIATASVSPGLTFAEMGFSVEEVNGWCGSCPTSDAANAGYLARIIYEHGKEEA